MYKYLSAAALFAVFLSAPSAANAGCTFYENADSKGLSMTLSGGQEFRRLGAFDDQFSSISCSKSCKAYGTVHAMQRGPKVWYGSGKHNLTTDRAGQYNNRLSSIGVVCS